MSDRPETNKTVGRHVLTTRRVGPRELIDELMVFGAEEQLLPLFEEGVRIF